MEPDIYVRYVQDGSSHWACLKNDVDVESKICDCGANLLMKPLVGRGKNDPLFPATASVGSRIYEFGGLVMMGDYYLDYQKNTAQVSYIDTNCPEQGWKFCENSMLKPLNQSYAFNYNDEKVVLVGGQGDDGRFDPYFIQIYDPYTDQWVHLPDKRSKLDSEGYTYNLDGHAVINREDGKRFVIVHSCDMPFLYSFDVDNNKWGHYWGEDFGTLKGSSALIDDIYYVSDTSDFGADNNFYLSGYNVNSAVPNCLPVEILPAKTGDEDIVDFMKPIEGSELFSLGNGKLAMVWHYSCFEDDKHEMLTICCCKFKMIKKFGPGGELKLFAEPLSKVRYHLKGIYFCNFLFVDRTKNTNFVAANLNTYKKRKIEEETVKRITPHGGLA